MLSSQRFFNQTLFIEQFANLNNPRVFETLKARLHLICQLCQRTLRRQVLPYVRYTKRLPMVQPFTPEEGEDRLYHLVSEYLRRDNLQALPAGQRSLMTLVLRKLLASSTFAIAGALETLCRRLRARLQQAKEPENLEEELNEDFETLDEMAEEWGEEDTAPESISTSERTALAREIADLESFRALAVSITHNAKGTAILTALQTAFAKAEGLGAARKAIVFTESRRTQEYLLRVLNDSPYKDGVVLFNGSNNDEKSRRIYADWLRRHIGTDRVTGSRSADMRSALVDYFSDQGQIMIATEAGAEGINLQFCSLVVNYDLPWNPQRIEQRIGRCHRYGQERDVVVVNFLNQKNAAEQRVFQLLSEKFSLFEGVFGASDEVLGAIESGVDFEKRIADIYQRCRTPEEINASFDQLQQELSQQIDEAMTRTRQQLLENFDAEVIEKLGISRDSSHAYLDHYERMLMDLTHHELRDHIKVLDVEDYLIVTALTDNGQPLDVEQAGRLLRLPACDCRTMKTVPASESLASITASQREAILQSISQRNAAFFEAEANKLDAWAEDLKVGLEREIKELDRQIKEARRAATAAPTLQEKLEAQKHVKSLEAHRNTRRRALFDAQDDIDRHREQLIADMEGKLGQKTILQELFSIRWKII